MTPTPPKDQTVPTKEEIEKVLTKLEKAGLRVLGAMDAHNEKHGTHLGGPAFFELGRSVAAARALLHAMKEGEDG